LVRTGAGAVVIFFSTGWTHPEAEVEVDFVLELGH
jgi:hypothetical protein